MTLSNRRLTNAPCGFFTLTHEGIFVEVNDTLLAWLGYTESDVLGKHMETFLSIANKMMFHSYFYPNINLDGSVEELFLSLRNSEGEQVPFLLNARQIMQEDSDVIECIVVKMKKRIDYEIELRTTKRLMEEAYLEKERALEQLQQIYGEIAKHQQDLKAFNSNLIKITNTDKLTNIFNRKFFEEQLAIEASRFDYEKIIFSFLILDIDHFKSINDTYGHIVGDQVLQQLAKLLTDSVREKDVVARYGGEEFVVILPNTEKEQAINLATRIKEAVQQTTWNIVGTMTISVGVSTYTKHDTEQSVVAKADEALYVSKANGRNRVTHYNEMEV